MLNKFRHSMETSVQNNWSSGYTILYNVSNFIVVLGYKLKNKARVYRREPKQIKGWLTIHSYKQYQELKKGIDQGTSIN